MKEKKYLAFDLGQSGGKAIVGKYDGKKIKLKEIYRFENNEVYAGGFLQWDILGLYNKIITGIRKALKDEGKIESMGIDSWGSDHSFIDKEGYLLGNPITNRDRRKEKALNSLYSIIPKKELFDITGVQLAESSSSAFSSR